MADQIWTGPIKTWQEPPARIILEGQMEDGQFRPARAAVPAIAQSQKTALIHNGAEFLTITEPKLFGVEERARIEMQGTQLVLTCAGGEAPAGVILQMPGHHFPRGIAFSLAVEATTTAKFAARITHPADEDTQWAYGEIARGISRIEISAIPWARVPTPSQIAILCPHDGAELVLNSVRMTIAARDADQHAATWIWRAQDFLEDPRIAGAGLSEVGVKTVFLQLPIADGAVEDGSHLANRIADLTRAGMTIVPVEGDPAMVLPKGRAHAVERLRTIRAFNEALPAGIRFSSIQYDIEPYLLPEFSDEIDAVWPIWADSVAALAETWERPISVVVPFWMIDSEIALGVLERAAPSIESVVVMVYRTAQEQVAGASEPWLAWGEQTGTRVRIALENGPLQEEIHRTYRRAETGFLMISKADGAATVTLHQSRVAASLDIFVYDFSHEVVAEPGRVSFLGDASRMRKMAKSLGYTFSAWTSFDGFAFHDLQ